MLYDVPQNEQENRKNKRLPVQQTKLKTRTNFFLILLIV